MAKGENKGEQGVQGAQGVQGIQGVRGSQGTQGTEGPQGAEGGRGKDSPDRKRVIWAYVGFVVIVSLVVLFYAFEFIEIRNLTKENRNLIAQIGQVRATGERGRVISRLVLCQELEDVKKAVREDTVRRLASARAFLDENPNGTRDFSVKVIEAGIRNLNRTRLDLQPRPEGCKIFAVNPNALSMKAPVLTKKEKENLEKLLRQNGRKGKRN